MFLPVKINGRGLIPRGHGLAPKSFVKADEQLVKLIMQTPGLSMEYIQPETNTLVPITRTNYMELFESHENYLNKNTATPKPVVNPVTPPVNIPPVTHTNPAPPVVEKKEEVKVEKKEEVKVEEKKEEKKEFTMKPVHKEDKK